jgi:tetratricopeptide (TPR) repeat protein
MIALLLAFVAGLASQGDPWAQLWTELEALRSGKVAAGEAEVFRAHLTEALRQGPEGPRTALLRTSLEVLAGGNGRAAAARLAALEPSPFAAREQWLLADLMAPGPERARLVRAALESPSTLSNWQVVLAWSVGVDEARALRLAESALPIQRVLHERNHASRSAEDLAQTYRALDRREEAEQVLREAIAQEEATGRQAPALWEERGLCALGFGDEPGARDYLGRALAQGSREAGLVLARMDLLAGRSQTARRGFQALILTEPPLDWAWRGWGTTLLPPPFEPPVQRIPTTPNE